MLLRQSRAATRAGFTLTEMLVVVAIIVVLAGIAVPITMSKLSEAKRDVAKAHIKSTLVPAVIHYRLKHEEQLPGSLDELIADPAAGLKRDALRDPWNRPYHYSPQTQHGSEDGFDVWSDGPKPGDPNSMIGNW
jgi:general secretion pathway protein G